MYLEKKSNNNKKREVLAKDLKPYTVYQADDWSMIGSSIKSDLWMIVIGENGQKKIINLGATSFDVSIHTLIKSGKCWQIKDTVYLVNPVERKCKLVIEDE